MKPSIGRIVIAETREYFNGSSQHPAIINRVWGEGEPQPPIGESPAQGVCVNVTVLPDCAPPFSMTSIMLFDNEADAMAAGFVGSRAWWPARV